MSKTHPYSCHMNRAPARLQTAILVLVVLLAGCATPGPGPSGPGTGPPPAITLAEMRLLDIHRRERKLMDAIAEDPEMQSRDSHEMRVGQLMNEYEAYLADNPDDVTARILYGKFLVRTGQSEAAIRQFLKADQLDPDVPVVKQQIGNYLAETGRYMAALPYFINATDLAPDEPVYFYQLGELLYRYREYFIEDGFYTMETLEEAMQAAFRRAAELAPENRIFQRRYAESFYDRTPPDWPGALSAWDALLEGAADEPERRTIQLHRARCLAELGRIAEARSLARSIAAKGAEQAQAREQLLQSLEASP